jgi:hypothetical protein
LKSTDPKLQKRAREELARSRDQRVALQLMSLYTNGNYALREDILWILERIGDQEAKTFVKDDLTTRVTKSNQIAQSDPEFSTIRAAEEEAKKAAKEAEAKAKEVQEEAKRAKLLKELEEAAGRPRWEYKTFVIQYSESSKAWNNTAAERDSIINEWGRKGWELVSVLGFNVGIGYGASFSVQTLKYELFFKRELANVVTSGA